MRGPSSDAQPQSQTTKPRRVGMTQPRPKAELAETARRADRVVREDGAGPYDIGHAGEYCMGAVSSSRDSRRSRRRAPCDPSDRDVALFSEG